ncbi:hypothetical protein EG829_32240, partial [bacterium]|nr:hypothetical protein [bacterium]
VLGRADWNFFPDLALRHEEDGAGDGGHVVQQEQSQDLRRNRDEKHQRVKNILSERRRVLDELAHLLSEKESIQGEEFRKMLSEPSREMVS